MQGDPAKLHLQLTGKETLCGLELNSTQWCEDWPDQPSRQLDHIACPFCRGLAMPSDAFRSVHFIVGGQSGAYVTCYQRVGKAPLIDINFYDGDRSMDETMLRFKALERAWELAKAWHLDTRDKKFTGVGEEHPSPA